MAKKNRSAKAARKARMARKAEKAAMRGEGRPLSRGRNLEVLGMILGRAGRGGSHGDARKERSRKACRGKVREG